MRKRIGVACAGLAIVASAIAMAPTTACTNHQCDYSFQDMPATGHVLTDGHTWVSSDIGDNGVPSDGGDNWLPFNGQQRYAFHIPQFYGWEVATTDAYLSTSPTPETDSVWTTAAGNDIEFSAEYWQNADPGAGTPANLTISVFNDTCAQYWVRVVITAYPYPDGGADATDEGDSPAESDASDESDTSTADASDASTDSDGLDAATDAPME